ncbi:fasciclin domain-containing protein [Calothrix sp. UHCC 0171]|uniref:fasciclin domain-containing protein n=1 Tax=Calothrix sp. UHCC 0171 TaxID=3110245 RepID=UPI002B1FB5B7|nr:fasciclin domain-containing protein [Calothrix sp. UHCC 0171]MEA5572834.1 fasciclin domain-containing protein [Calothrix sp. UHCC 0171]
MKVDNSKLLTKLAGIVGVTGIGLLINLPAGAQEKLNPNPSIFSEATYSRTQRVLTNTQYLPSEPALAQEKQQNSSGKKKKTQTAQTTTIGGKLNPSPSIKNECPYNRAACPGAGTSAPITKPAEPDVTPAPSEPEVKPQTEGTDKPSESSDTSKNIVAVAESNGSFTTLTKLLKSAGLVETLQGAGPFTVFAPTDAAFAELEKKSPNVIRDLLKPENKEVLVKVLTYHVVQGQILSSDLKAGEVKTIEGGPLSVKIDSATGVNVNDAKVTQADVKASNGVIHVIDNILVPRDL